MKKTKTYAAVMLAAGLLSLLGCAPAFADAEGFTEEYYRFQNPDGLLSEDEEATLNEELDDISHNQNFDVTAALVNSLDGQTVEAYADNLYDDCNYGYGDDRDGVLLLVSLEDHDWYISTSGFGITAFTDAGIQYIGEQIKPQLADGEYLEAFENYIELCDDFINQANKGEPYDVDHMPKKALSPIWLGISFVIGLGGALLVVGVNKSELKSVGKQDEAKNYVRPGSMKVTNRSDFFLYRKVTRTEKPKPKSSGSGGSSTHSSSSGRTHGGGGGKF